MKKKFQTGTKALSILLILLFLLQTLPMQVFAQSLSTTPHATDITTRDAELELDEEALLLYEIPEKRDAYTKVYRRSDGTYTAYVSSAPLHQKREGNWVDIDNTLCLQTQNGKSFFANADNPLHVIFPKTLSVTEGVALESNGYTLSFVMEHIQKSEGTLTTTDSAEVGDSILPDTLKVQSETAVYADVFPQTALEYSISSHSVKENIVIDVPAAVRETYTFRLQADDSLTTQLFPDGSVHFCAPSGQEIFSLPAPFMKDASNAVSNQIDVSLTGQDGAYSLTYRPNQEWLQSDARVYPVVLDPMVLLDEEWFTQACVTTNAPDEPACNGMLNMVVNGKMRNEAGELVTEDAYAETYVQLHLDKIGILTEDITPIEAQFVFQGAGMNLAAYEITQAVDLQNVTYNTKPTYAAEPIDYYSGSMSDALRAVHFNITKLLNAWLSGTKENNGFAIYAYNDTEPATGLFFSRGSNVGNSFLLIDFVESAGYSNNFDYHTQDIDRAGTSYINDFSQRLTIKRDDIAISGNIMPVSIAFLYNPAIFLKVDKYTRLLTNRGESAAAPLAVYGNGWLTNYNRFLYINDQLDSENPDISYADENGSIIHFNITVDEEGTVLCNAVDGSGYTLTGFENVPENCETYGIEYLRLKTPNGTVEQFDSVGRLTKIYKEKYPAQAVNIAYVTADTAENINLYAIDSITDGAGRKYAFVYDANSGRLQNIRCYTADGTEIKAGSTASALKMTYSYNDSGNLTQVSFPDSGAAYYEYDGQNRLTAANSRNMYKLTYTYDNFGRVRSVTESAQDISKLTGFQEGNVITVTADGPKQVTFSDKIGTHETIQFDKYGKTVLVSDARGNYVDAESGIQRTLGINILKNQSFENGWTNWEYDAETPALERVASDAHSGSYAAKLSADTETNTGFAQTVPIASSGTYTFSAYIKAPSGYAAQDRLMMLAVAVDAAGEALPNPAVRTVAATSAEYTRYSVTLNAPENAANIIVCINLADSKGTFYIDSLQLERGSGFGAFNLLANSDFSAQSGELLTDWSGTNGYTVEAQTVNNVLCAAASFPASKSAAHTLSQTVALNGKAGDIVTFGGWMKADVVSNTADCMLAQVLPDETSFSGDRFAGVTLTYTYTTEEDGQTVTKTQTERKSIQDFILGWQFVSNSVILKGDCTEVTFAFEYTKHPAAVEIMLPCLSLDVSPIFAEEEQPDVPEDGETDTPPAPVLCVCGETCQYGDGCPCTCTDAESCNCPECKGCVCETCTRLGCTCRCESEAVCECPQCKKLFDITYDEFGNLLSLKISGYSADQLLSMLTKRTFSASGNYMTSSTDENGATVQYAYNETNGMLTKETDARGNSTEYSYNALGALTQVKTPVSGLQKEALGLIQPQAMVTNYAYLNDRVVTIQHNDFAYYIDYDQWNNVDRLYANELNAALGALATSYVAKYTYGTGANHSRLESVRYGNGGTVHYRYDENNRIVGISYDGGETDRFVYGYDALGNVVSVYDAQSMRTVLYNENSVEVYYDTALIYFSGIDSDGNRVEYNGGVFTLVTKETESSRDPETGITASKKEFTANDVRAELLKSTDAFGRTQEKAAIVRGTSESENGEATPFAAVVTDYTYHTASGKVAQGRVKAMRSRVTYGTSMAEENATRAYFQEYYYDKNGNISHVLDIEDDEADIWDVRYNYEYDEANQLVRVDDNIGKKTYTYQYDKGGNRVSEKIYPYTESAQLGTPEREIKSQYTFLQWKDRLYSYDGKQIKYDIAGNPISYGDQKYIWNGKQLTEIVNPDGTRTTFAYDANGFRTEKHQIKADGTEEYVVYYIWTDGVLTQQYLLYNMEITIRGETRRVQVPFLAEFLYDDSKQAQGCIINGDAGYLFLRNLQGDVIALADMEGKVMMEFNYDPWGRISYTYFDENGNPTDAVTDEEMSLITAVFCPITYRGYNYDFTTGLYYLQSRYYNPDWGRFLNCDDTSILLATQGTTHGANLFAYCNNDPVNWIDPSGYWGKDVHYTYTLQAASRIFNSFDAEILAQADIDVDTLYPPFPPALHPIRGDWHWRINQKIHFNRNPEGLADSRLIISLFMLLLSSKLWVEAELLFERSAKTDGDYHIRNYGYYRALTYLGYGLHALQDIDAHGNIGVGNKCFAQHLISSNGRLIHKADDINYSWTDGSRTALFWDSNRTRYKQTQENTIAYLNSFLELVTIYRKENHLPQTSIKYYRRFKISL